MMDFSKLGGLIPAVVQDYRSGEVLMVGFMNEEAWDITRRSGYVTFFSRTRNKLWTKGETSGNRLAVRKNRQRPMLAVVEMSLSRDADGAVYGGGDAGGAERCRRRQCGVAVGGADDLAAAGAAAGKEH